MSPRPSVEALRRDEVMSATWQLITELGAARVRVADIAERVGSSTGTVHYYFDTKRDVLDAAFRYAVEESRRRSAEALAGHAEPWTRLVALLEAHMPRGDVQKEWLIWLQLWAEASVRPELRSLNDEHYRQWIDRVEEIVLDGQAKGTFRAIDARDFATRLLTMMDGLVIQLTMNSTEIDLPHLRRLLFGFAQEQLAPA